jgi:hypothetical protein
LSNVAEENLKMMKKKYGNWLKESEVWVADLKKRPQKAGITQMEGSFRSLQLD